ncbi:MAG: META domain-containing protein [Candidatus Pacebacteria bacterium]|nr:META domain-containing protein [Candidatus Paceibacterota bacterium]
MKTTISGVTFLVVSGLMLVLGGVAGFAFSQWSIHGGGYMNRWDSKEDRVGKPGEETQFALTCTNNYKILATYPEARVQGIAQKLILTVENGETMTEYEMTPAQSGSGARFATQDGVYSLWEHQDEFRFMANEEDLALCHKTVVTDKKPDIVVPEVTTDNELLGKTWTFIDATTPEGKTFRPKREGVFTLQFEREGNVRIGTDCNSVGGEYTVSGSSLEIGQTMTTMMYCEGSEESDFTSLLSFVRAYTVTKGTLRLELTGGTGEMRFN